MMRMTLSTCRIGEQTGPRWHPCPRTMRTTNRVAIATPASAPGRRSGPTATRVVVHGLRSWRQPRPRSKLVKYICLHLALIVFSTSVLMAQENTVRSDVYRWNDLKVEKDASRERRSILQGSTTDLENLEIHATTLAPGKAPHPSHTHEAEEELVIVKEGQLRVTINDESKVLGPGSIALIVPGEEHGFENAGDTQASYYIMKYRSKLPMDKERGQEAGGSLMVDWNDLAFNAHDRGGIRRYFDRPTAMCKNFEMHVTTLNGGLKSHEPHTHRAAEIVLIIEGNTEMQIGDEFYKGTQGDLYFLASEIPHAIRNTGKNPSVYFAFQWE